MVKSHERPCILCRYSSGVSPFGKPGTVRCMRPAKAECCPVLGLYVQVLNRRAKDERSRDVSLLRRKQCGPDGAYFAQGLPISPPPPPPRG